MQFNLDNFIDGQALLRVERKETNGTEQYEIAVEKGDNCYTVEVLSSLLAYKGTIKLQLVIMQENLEVFKSKYFNMKVLEAIEAGEEIPEQYPTWQQLASQKIIEINNKIDEVTDLEEDLEGKVQSGYFNGFSPTVQTKAIENGVQVTITDVNGPHTFTVLNGQDGQVDEQTVAQAVQSYLEQNPIQVPTAISELTEDSTHRTVTDIEKTSWNNKSNFSGNYNDLSNKPTIPAEVTENTVSGWGFTKNTGTYSKPQNGIPKTDLETAVQTSLGKADTALQAHQDISGKLDTIKVKNTNSTTEGDVYDVRYINSVIGDISTILASLVSVGGGD